MFRHRLPLRLATTLLMVVSLLFSQLVLANYVCPGTAQMMATGEPCEGMDAAQPVLCHQHGATATPSFEVVKAASPSLPAIVQVLVVPLALDPADTAAVSLTVTRPMRPPPDPIFLATLRLRV